MAAGSSMEVKEVMAGIGLCSHSKLPTSKILAAGVEGLGQAATSSATISAKTNGAEKVAPSNNR